MYKIMNPVWKKETVDFQRPFVHPFYKIMFQKVYGLSEREAAMYIGKDGPVTDSCDFLEPLVEEVWEKHKNCTSRFYDIRTSGEAGQAAPEYAILKRAGIRNISPVSICGMGSMALLLGLQVMEMTVHEGDCAIMLLTDLDHSLDTQRENIACAFALYPCKNVGSQEGIWITDYQVHLSAAEVRAAAKDFKGTIIFSEVELENFNITSHYTVCKKGGLITPFLYLNDVCKKAEHEEVLSIHASGNTYGLISYYVWGKEGG